MSQAKKNEIYLNVCVEKPIYARLEMLWLKTEQTKIIAVERALSAYLDKY